MLEDMRRFGIPMVYVKNAQKIFEKIVKKNVWLYTDYIGLQ